MRQWIRRALFHAASQPACMQAVLFATQRCVAIPLQEERYPCTECQLTQHRPLVQVMRLLTFANTAEPPEAWVKAHQALARGLHRACSGDEALQQACQATFDLRWYAGVQARLHINSFRCQACPSHGLADSPIQVLPLAHVLGTAGRTSSAPLQLASPATHLGINSRAGDCLPAQQSRGRAAVCRR